MKGPLALGPPKLDGDVHIIRWPPVVDKALRSRRDQSGMCTFANGALTDLEIEVQQGKCAGRANPPLFFRHFVHRLKGLYLLHRQLAAKHHPS